MTKIMEQNAWLGCFLSDTCSGLGVLRILIGKHDGSGSVDLRPASGRSHCRTSALIDSTQSTFKQ